MSSLLVHLLVMWAAQVSDGGGRHGRLGEHGVECVVFLGQGEFFFL